MKPNSGNPDDSELELQNAPIRKLPASKVEPVRARPKTGPVTTLRPKAPQATSAHSDADKSDGRAMVDESPDISIDTTDRDASAAPIEGELPADGPPPSEKVDFENLPEFVWQRKMLRNVRIVMIVVSIVVALVIAIAFFGTGKGAKESLKPIIEGEKPGEETKP